MTATSRTRRVAAWAFVLGVSVLMGAVVFLLLIDARGPVTASVGALIMAGIAFASQWEFIAEANDD